MTTIKQYKEEVEKEIDNIKDDYEDYTAREIIEAKLEAIETCEKIMNEEQIELFKENMLMTKTNHQLGCMLECYQSVIENRLGFEKEAKQLLEIASKLK